MYVDPFVCGVIATILTEVVFIIGASIYLYWKGGRK